MADKKAETLAQAEREIALASKAKDVFNIGQRWWATLVQTGNDADLIKSLDRMIQVRLKELNELNKDIVIAKIEKGQYLAPTPPVGWRVQWFQANDHSKVFAADVVNVERCGQVELKLHKPKNGHFGAADNVLGVRHRSDPVHDGTRNPTTVQHGSWDYLPGEKAPESHFDVARSEMAVREKNSLEAEGKRRERERSIQLEQDAARSQRDPITV